MIPAALSLPLLLVLTVGRAPTIFQNDWFCTRISNFFQSPIFWIARGVGILIFYYTNEGVGGFEAGGDRSEKRKEREDGRRKKLIYLNLGSNI